VWIIRDEQLAVFERAEEERFLAEAAAAVRRDGALADDDLEEPELRRRVRIAFARARAWGFEARRDLVAFITMMVALGPNFDRRLPFSRILGRDLPAAVRMDMLLGETHLLEWQRVLNAGEDDPWPADEPSPGEA